MRFLFYDRVVELEKRESIVGLKAFTLSEEFLGCHFRGAPRIPGTILIESMAQLLGWLIAYSHDFKVFAIMSLLEGVEVASDLRPGLQAQIRAEIVSTTHKDTLGRAQIQTENRRIAVIERIIYMHFGGTNPAKLAQLFRYYSGLKVLPEEPIL